MEEPKRASAPFAHGIDNVVVEQLKVLVVHPVLHVPLAPGEEVVGDDDFVSGQHQTVHQVGADEAGAAYKQRDRIVHISSMHLRQESQHPPVMRILFFSW